MRSAAERIVALYVVVSLAAALFPARLEPLLHLVPARPLRAWTWFTYALVERSPLLLPVVIPFLLLTLRYFERVWSARPLLLFVAFCVPAAAVAWLALMFVCSLVPATSTPTLDKVSSVRGTAGLFASIVLAFRHTIPEHRLDCYFFAFRVKFLPFTVFVGSLVLAVLRVISRSQFSFFCIALLVAWIYIRYLRFQDGLRGDRSDAFAFASLFPDQVKPLVHPLSNFIHRALVRLRVVRPSPPPLDMELGFAALSARSRRFLSTSTSTSASTAASSASATTNAAAPLDPLVVVVEPPPSLPTSSSSSSPSSAATTDAGAPLLAASMPPQSEAERRKALALKAVEDRLRQKSKAQQQQQQQQQQKQLMKNIPTEQKMD